MRRALAIHSLAGLAAAVLPSAALAQTGACCLSLGNCTTTTSADCVNQSGIYHGDGTACAAGTCDYFIEAEPNESKAQANAVTLADGQFFRGRTTGTSLTAPGIGSADTFRLKTLPAALGVYRHRVSLASDTVGHSATIRGLGQTAAAPPGPWPGPVGTANATDSIAQNHLVVGTDRVDFWYGFGREEEVYYRVTGAAATTSHYTATYSTAPVTPVDLGTFTVGDILINTSGQSHNNDTHVRIYDSNLDPVAGFANDDASQHAGAPLPTTTTSYLRRTYPAGTYYMAIAMGNLATSSGSPCDDNTRGGVMLDFPNAAVETSTLTTTDVSFSVTHGGGQQAFSAARPGPREVAWFRFTVSGAAPTGACCFPSGACQVVTPGACLLAGGIYGGDGATCATQNCTQPPTGACCLPTGGCSVMYAGGCTGQGGTYGGDNSACGSAGCTNVVVTNTYAAIEGETNNSFPFTFTSAYQRYQQVHRSSEFSGLSGPHRVTAIRLRQDTQFAATWSESYTLTLRLSTTTAGPDGMSTTFASNLGADATVVYNGPITISSSQSPNVPPIPKPFDVVITLQTPFVYDPTAGNLLMDVERQGAPTGNRPLDAVNNVGDGFSRLFSTTAGATTGSADSVGLVIQFAMEPAGNPCYANCDGSTQPPVLNVGDFTCFLQKFTASDPYANCDGSTQPPVLNVGDFTCFLQKFSAGCP